VLKGKTLKIQEITLRHNFAIRWRISAKSKKIIPVKPANLARVRCSSWKYTGAWPLNGL